MKLPCGSCWPSRWNAIHSILFGLSALTMASEFVPPSSSERLEAIGPTRDLPAVLQRALDPGQTFAPISRPGPGDWLAAHPEKGQTFEAFVESRPNRPSRERSKLRFRPLGGFPEGQSPSLDLLKQFAEAYFSMDVRLQPAAPIDDPSFTRRVNRHTGKRQVLTGDVLAMLKKDIPADAFCVLAITMEDLYPDPTWNFVFGEASLYERVGVFSFARYDPAFYGENRTKEYRQVLLWRSCKVLAHETGHMFGMKHCVYFNCLMNGSNHLQESDARPMHLCPVCLRKLHSVVGFDVVERYRNLGRFYAKAGLAEEARWVEERIRTITGEAERPAKEPGK